MLCHKIPNRRWKQVTSGDSAGYGLLLFLVVYYMYLVFITAEHLNETRFVQRHQILHFKLCIVTIKTQFIIILIFN